MNSSITEEYYAVKKHIFESLFEITVHTRTILSSVHHMQAHHTMQWKNLLNDTVFHKVTYPRRYHFTWKFAARRAFQWNTPNQELLGGSGSPSSGDENKLFLVIEEHPKFQLNFSFADFNLSFLLGCNHDYLIVNSTNLMKDNPGQTYKFCGKRYRWTMFLQGFVAQLLMINSRAASFQLFYQVMRDNLIKVSCLCLFLLSPQDTCPCPQLATLHISLHKHSGFLAVTIFSIKVFKFHRLLVTISKNFKNQAFDGPTSDSKVLKPNKGEGYFMFSGFMGTLSVMNTNTPSPSDFLTYSSQLSQPQLFEKQKVKNLFFSTENIRTDFYFQSVWFTNLSSEKPLKVKLVNFNMAGTHEDVDFDRFGGLAVYFLSTNDSVKEIFAAKYDFGHHKGKSSLYDAISEQNTTSVIIVFYSYTLYSQYIEANVSVGVSSCLAMYTTLNYHMWRHIYLNFQGLKYHRPSQKSVCQQDSSNPTTKRLDLHLDKSRSCLKVFLIQNATFSNITMASRNPASRVLRLSSVFCYKSPFHKMSIISHFLNFKLLSIPGPILLVDLYKKPPQTGPFFRVKDGKSGKSITWHFFNWSGMFAAFHSAFVDLDLACISCPFIFLRDIGHIPRQLWLLIEVHAVTCQDHKQVALSAVSFPCTELFKSENYKQTKVLLVRKDYNIHPLGSFENLLDLSMSHHAVLDYSLGEDVEIHAPKNNTHLHPKLVHFCLSNQTKNVTANATLKLGRHGEKLTVQVPKTFSFYLPTTDFPICSAFDLQYNSGQYFTLTFFFHSATHDPCELKFVSHNHQVLHFSTESMRKDANVRKSLLTSVHYCSMQKIQAADCFKKYASWYQAKHLCEAESMFLPEIFSSDDMKFLESQIRKTEEDIFSAFQGKAMTAKLYQTMAVYIGAKHQVDICWQAHMPPLLSIE